MLFLKLHLYLYDILAIFCIHEFTETLNLYLFLEGVGGGGGGGHDRYTGLLFVIILTFKVTVFPYYVQITKFSSDLHISDFFFYLEIKSVKLGPCI